MFNRVLSAAIVGIDVIPVQVEVDVSDGLPQFTMVGSLTGQVREAEDRVRTSLRNIGIALPPKKITVNLAPADVLKNGSGFDLPIALGILAGEQKIPADSLNSLMAIGELSLNGDINPVSGILPSALQARKLGIHTMLVPAGNESEKTFYLQYGMTKELKLLSGVILAVFAGFLLWLLAVRLKPRVR